MQEIDSVNTWRQRTKTNLKEIFKANDTREVAVFFTSQFVGFLVFLSLRQIFPLYLQKTTGLTEEEVVIKWAIIVAAYTFGGIITRIPSGLFIEKIGRRNMIVISYFLTIGSIVGLAFTKNTILLAVLFIILRTGNNSFGLSSRSLLSDLETKYKGFYNSMISTAGRFGSLIGTIALGVLLDFFKPYIMLVFAGILAVIGLIIFLYIFIEGKGEDRFKKRQEVKWAGNKVRIKRKDFLNSIFIFFFFAFVIFGIMEGFSNPIFSLYGKNVINLSDSLVGILIGLSNISFILVGPIIGLAISDSKKIVNSLLLAAPILLACNFLMIFLFPSNQIVYTVFLFVRNVGHALFFPVVMTILTSELSKDLFTILYSVITTAFFLGIAATSYFSGILYTTNITYPWLSSLVSAILLILVMIAYILYNRTREVTEIKREEDFVDFK
ncbi:MAG: MFS transporter [Candidatus Heimdallarchaeota archaeon]|nr:MFS transporter [Candidatus Heimdallarchaeota archaeon]MCK4876381.1 MFS transporter [Candidatus Heimdallarchaeota archaeon]